MKKERVFIILDGSNFFHRLKDPVLSFKNTLNFDYKGLVFWLAKDRKIVEYIYYIGLVRNKKKDKKGGFLVRNQQKLFSLLKKQGWNIKTGFMMQNDGIFHEKGVDVKMAVDILDKAHKDEYDTVIIISSDTDLIPAIEKVKEMNKKVEYIGFSHKPSFGMQKNSDISKLLTKEELEIFCTKTLI